jgi:hypothetical protein
MTAAPTSITDYTKRQNPENWFFLWGERGMGRAQSEAKTHFLVPNRQLQTWHSFCQSITLLSYRLASINALSTKH